MKKSITLLTLSLLLVVTTAIGQNYTMEHGVKLPNKLGKEKKLLHLNGSGVRNKFFINIYVLGLYVTNKTNDAHKVIEADEPMSVRLTIISNLVTRDKMIEVMRDGFELSLKGDVSKHQKSIDAVCDIFRSTPVNIGDTYDISYIPSRGLFASKNGSPLPLNGVSKSLDFKKAVFGIWLEDEPVCEDLRDDILNIN